MPPTPTRRKNLNTPIAKIPGIQEHVQRATPAVKRLTPKDLDDLALRFRGQAIDNPKVTKLTFKDVESLEQVFMAQKTAAAGLLRPGSVAVDVSCCCCTPCCCCT